MKQNLPKTFLWELVSMKYKKHIIIFIFALFSITNVNAKDTIDSLLFALQYAKTDIERMQTYTNLSLAMYTRDADSGLIFGEKALLLTEKLGDRQFQAKALLAIAWNQIVKSKYPQALDYLYKSLSIYEEIMDSSGTSRVLNSIGVVFASSNDFNKGIQYLNRALEISSAINNKQLMVKDLSTLAEMYMSLKNILKAKEYFIKAIAINKSMGDQAITMNLYSGIAGVYAENREYDNAISNYTKSIKIAKAIKRPINLAYNYMQIGSICYDYAIDTNKTIDCTMLPSSKIVALTQAIKYIQFAKIQFEELKSINEIRTSYDLLYRTYKALGNTDSALRYFELLVAMNDSAKVTETTNKMAKLESDREIKSRDDKLKIIELEIKNSRRANTIIALVALAIGIILLLVVISLKNRQRLLRKLEEKNKTISETNATKDKFFSIIAHDLKSPFSGFINLTKFMSEYIEEFTKGELVESAKSLNKSAIGLYKLLENLLEWSRIQRGLTVFNPIELSANDLVNDCVFVLQDFAVNKDIKLINSIPTELTIIADPQMLSTLFRNLISNAIKFTHQHGQVEIGSQSMQDTHQFYVKDNGVGMSQETIDKLFRIDQKVSNLGTDGESSTGLGLLLCKEFVLQHKGKIWIESEMNKGSIFYFDIPKSF